MAGVRTALSMIALVFAALLAAPWHGAGQRTDCPIFASLTQAAPAQARKAAPAQPETTALARGARPALLAVLASRPRLASRAAPGHSLPLYLLNQRLLR